MPTTSNSDREIFFGFSIYLSTQANNNNEAILSVVENE